MKPKRSYCPVSRALDVWGDKWSLLIIRDLMFNKRNTYGDFQKAPEKIATNILATRLQMLEEAGIIQKTEHEDNKVKWLYGLTQKGIDLCPVLVEINLWGDKYYPLPKESEGHEEVKNLRRILRQIKKDKAAFIAGIGEDARAR